MKTWLNIKGYLGTVYTGVQVDQRSVKIVDMLYPWFLRDDSVKVEIFFNKI